MIFDVLRELVQDHMGEDAWDEIVLSSGASGIYTNIGTYDDDELRALVQGVADRMGSSPGDVLRWYGEHATPLFFQRHPDLFAFRDTIHLVSQLNRVIHPEIHKLHPGAQGPEFEYLVVEEDHLVMNYRSERRMCTLAEGLILGAARHFGQQVDVAQTACMDDGADACTLEVRYA